MRKSRGVTQDDMAVAIGISRTTYQKLESGTDDNPRFRYLMNCAFALDCDVFDLIEDEWRSWKIFDTRRDDPPEPEHFFRNTPESG